MWKQRQKTIEIYLPPQKDAGKSVTRRAARSSKRTCIVAPYRSESNLIKYEIIYAGGKNLWLVKY